MKYVSMILTAFALLMSQHAFAASCNVDKQQMYAQIAKYQSISTKKCPLNAYGWGITNVTGEKKAGSNTCSAKCSYYSGPGSNGKVCSWEMGNWGDTLACH